MDDATVDSAFFIGVCVFEVYEEEVSGGVREVSTCLIFKNVVSVGCANNIVAFTL